MQRKTKNIEKLKIWTKNQKNLEKNKNLDQKPKSYCNYQRTGMCKSFSIEQNAFFCFVQGFSAVGPRRPQRVACFCLSD